MLSTLSTEEVIIYNGKRGITFHNTIHSLLKRANIVADNFMDEKSMKIYDQAFTAVSADPNFNYEMYEQLGDVTVNRFLVWYMYKRFPQLKCPQGVKVVARLRINYGARQSFATIGEKLGFWDFISASEEERSRRKKDLLEDCVESFIGATETIIDQKHRSGIGQIVAFDILSSIFDEIPISLKYEDLYDAKTRLKELYDFHKTSLGQLKYNSTRDEESGIFSCEVSDSVFKVIGKGSASKQKDAEQKGAEVALTSMKKRGYVKAVPSEYQIFTETK